MSRFTREVYPVNDILLWVVLVTIVFTLTLTILLSIKVPKVFDGVEKDLREELRLGREENRSAGKELRQEVAAGLSNTSETIFNSLNIMGQNQKAQLDNMSKQLKELADSSRNDLDRIRSTFDTRIRELQDGNEKKLDEMRKIVDEKLQDTLEKRLGESFTQVSKRLEEVYRGLGEMKNLAVGVGDLKRVLSNVKARGTWAEIQLGAILEETLTNNQYEKNVRVNPDTREVVEYAIKLPGSKDDPEACVWLPIDSKFPQEDYVRIYEAAEEGDPVSVQTAADNLARTVKVAAKAIKEKYLCPPYTTDFAIMFLATEGLYAEVLRQPGLVEELQHQHRVVIAGPTTITAILNSFRMGFQTLSIEKQAAEVWRVLGAVKTEFGKFGDTLSKVKRQIDTASKSIESTEVRTRAMERKLRSVEQLPEEEAEEILSLPQEVFLLDGEDE